MFSSLGELSILKFATTSETLKVSSRELIESMQGVWVILRWVIVNYGPAKTFDFQQELQLRELVSELGIQNFEYVNH